MLLPLMAITALATADVADAARVRVVRRGPRHRVVVRTGFPIRRRLPAVYVRAPRLTVRVAPRLYLPPVVFGALVVATLPPPEVRLWTDAETLEREEGWTDFTLVADRRGTGLLLEIDRGKAQIAFAEVVFENGEAQVVDFSDRTRSPGAYTLLDFRDGRKVDHVRVVAQAVSDETTIRLHLLQ